MENAQLKTPMTVAEYLEIERSSEEKHEFYQGELFAMTGATRFHNVISGNIYSLFRNRFRDKPCQAFIADVRLLIDEHGHYVYPDVMVVCDKKAYVDEDTVNDATVIVEVLSSSTESYDRGKKFLHYQSLPSLQDYVLISQTEMRVESFHRQPQDWLYRSLSQPHSQLSLPSIDYTCTLEDIYEDVILNNPSS